MSFLKIGGLTYHYSTLRILVILNRVNYALYDNDDEADFLLPASGMAGTVGVADVSESQQHSQGEVEAPPSAKKAKKPAKKSGKLEGVVE